MRRALLPAVVALALPGPAAAAFPWPAPGRLGPLHEPVPILMYHVVNAPPPNARYPQLFVSPLDFSGQIAWLAGHGYTAVTLGRVWAHWRLGWPLPRRPVVLSFDDGYRADYVNVRPALRARLWPGVLNLEVHNLQPSWGLRPWEVRALIADGWEIDAHTITHPDLTHVDSARLRTEVQGSRSDIQKQFGVPVNFFCYPSGRYDDAVIAAVRAAGFLAATTTQPGLAAPASPYTLSRVRVNASDGVGGLALKLAALGLPS